MSSGHLSQLKLQKLVQYCGLKHFLQRYFLILAVISHNKGTGDTELQ